MLIIPNSISGLDSFGMDTAENIHKKIIIAIVKKLNLRFLTQNHQKPHTNLFFFIFDTYAKKSCKLKFIVFNKQ